MRLTITTDNGSYEVEKRGSDDMAFCKTARLHGWSQTVTDEPLQYIYFVAYSASKRAGYVDSSTGFETWLETVIDVAYVDAEGDSDSHF